VAAHPGPAAHPACGNREERKQLEVERLGILDEMSLILRGGENAPSQARNEGRH